MDAEGLIPRLISEFNYPPQGARLIAAKLVHLTPPVREAFLTWWTEGTTPQLQIEGYSVQRLQDEHRMKLIAALLTLDWLTREPAKALASLQRGHDYVR